VLRRCGERCEGRGGEVRALGNSTEPAGGVASVLEVLVEKEEQVRRGEGG